MRAGFNPSEFWRETPRTFVNAMEGAALLEKREFDLAIVTAWHTAVFALNGYAGKLKGKSLSDYLISDKPEHSASTSTARMRAFFHGLKAKGLPIQISRNEIN